MYLYKNEPNIRYNSKCRFYNSKGITLVEIVVALSILIIPLLTIVLVFRSGGYVSEQFSKEHYTAMFLAKKVIEDISHRLNSNPYYFTELIRQAEGEKLEVVDGQHPLFKLIENTSNNTFLDSSEDSPIVTGMPLYNQLKKFKIQVSSSFIPMSNNILAYKNLIEVAVKVFWADSYNREQSYVTKQRFYGYNQDLFKEPPSNIPAAFSDIQIASSLWHLVPPAERSSSLNLQEFLTKNGGDEDTVKAIGQMLFACDYINTLINNSDIISLQQAVANHSSIDKQKIIKKERLAEILEITASDIFNTLVRIFNYARFLNASNITSSSLGRYLISNKTKVVEAITTIMLAPINISSLLYLAKNEYGSLLDNNFVNILPLRKIPSIAIKLTEIIKFQLFLCDNQNQASVYFNELRDLLNAYENNFRGKFPHLIDFVIKEKNICNSIDSLEVFYGKTQGFVKLIKSTIDEISNLSKVAIDISNL